MIAGNNRLGAPSGIDSVEARAMWQATAPRGGGYGARGFQASSRKTGQ